MVFDLSSALQVAHLVLTAINIAVNIYIEFWRNHPREK